MTNQNDGHDPQHGPDVTITINAKPFTIHRGRETVAKIKETGGVPAAEELEQVIDGVFTPLADDGSVTLKGGEIFVSHVRASAAA
jgi:hypothetical protein